MKLRQVFFLATATIVALTACKKQPVVEPTPSYALKLNTSLYGFTKATDTAFESGDEIGVNVFTEGGDWISNAKFVSNGSALTSDKAYEWYEETEVEGTITAYYPYNSNVGETFTVNADQSTSKGYKDSDLLVASTKSYPTENAVNLPFKHALSKVIINVDNQLKEEIANVWFTDVFGSVTFDSKNPAGIASTGSKGTIKAYKSGDNTWQLILAPQADVTPNLALTTASGKQYTFVLSEGVSFSAGKVSTANVSVSTESIYTSFTSDITDWVADNDLNFSQEDTPVELPEETKSCKLIIKVNKSIEWYDKYIYAWDSNETKLTGEWPGTKAEWDKVDGDYYVYYHIFDASLDGKTFNYIINGNGAGQTKDLTVTLSGAETTVTIEKSDVQ